MSDLRDRAPGHSLIEKLMSEWDAGRIRMDEASGVVTIDDESVSWFQGVLGERRVAALLAELEPDHVLLHSVPIGRGTSDVDHVVLGPSGVTIINTKYQPGKDIWSAGRGLRVGGFENRYVISLVTSVRAVEDRLSRAAGFAVPVRGVLCFVDPGRMSLGAPAGFEGVPVHVVSQADLFGAILTRREVSDAQLVRIIEVASRADTWHDAPTPSQSGAAITAEFEALHEAIGEKIELGFRTRVLAARARSARRSSGARRPAARSTRAAVPPPARPSRSPEPRRSTQGAVALAAAWPVLTVVVATVLGAAVRALGPVVLPGYLALLAIVFVLPPLLALLDLRELRARGAPIGAGVAAFVALTPLVYLIVRGSMLAAAGRRDWAPVGLHLLFVGFAVAGLAGWGAWASIITGS